jgi:methylated-DNA-[protein]-cysteine S-methyltransferase
MSCEPHETPARRVFRVLTMQAKEQRMTTETSTRADARRTAGVSAELVTTEQVTAGQVTAGQVTAEHTILATRLGDLTIVRDGAVLTGLYFPHHWYRPSRASLGRRGGEGFAEVTRQLGEYLDGTRTEFGLPLDARGTEFQRRVWALIAEIPYGQTTSYGDLARRLGGDANARDVGGAVGRNPLSILIPCHRVVGSTGKLTGYAGGLARKRALLDLERTGSPGLW